MIKNNIILLFIVFSILVLIPSSAARGLPTSDAEPGHQAEIESKLDLGHPDVMRTAVTMARDYPGEFSINQVSAIYRHLVEEKAWNYFNDPSSQEYYKYANQTLEDGYRAGTEAVGDCDDFAILMASLVETLGGSSRIIFAQDEVSGKSHAYTELFLGKKDDRIVDEIEKFIRDDWGKSSVPGLSSSDDDTIWLNLDYNATYPGGSFFGKGKATTEVAWISGNRTDPKIVPLIDSMDSLGSWQIIKDNIGSNISIKNVASRNGKAIEMSYELMGGGFVGIARDVDPKLMADLEGINFTYLTTSAPSILEMVLIDDNHTEYNLSWSVSGRERVGRPEWVYLQGLFSDLHKIDLKNRDLLEEMLNRSKIKYLKFIIHRSSDEGDISSNGRIAIDQIRGVLRIPTDSIWNKVKDERERALAVQLAIDSKQVLDQSPHLIERSLLLAVESMRRHPTSNGYQALIDSLTLYYPQKWVAFHNDSVTKVKFSPDGKYLATACRDGTTKLLDLNCMINTNITLSGKVDFVVFSPNSKYLATTAEGIVNIFDIGTRQSKIFGDRLTWLTINDLEFSSNSRYLATAGQDGHVKLMDAENKLIISDMPFGRYVNDVEFSPDDKYLAMVCCNGSTKVLDLETNQIVISLVGNNLSSEDSDRYACNRENNVRISEDSNYMVVSSDFGARLFDLNTRKEVAWYKDNMVDAEFSPDCKYLAAATFHGLKLIDLETLREMEIELYFESLDKIMFSPDSKYLALVNGLTLSGQRVKLLDIRTKEIVATIPHSDKIWDIEFSQNSNYLATASDDRKAKVLAINTGVVMEDISHTQTVFEVEFSPNSRFLATASFDGTSKRLDLESGNVAIAGSHNSSLTDIEFSPDDLYLASASLGGIVKLQDIKTNEFVIAMPKEYTRIRFVLSPDSNYTAIYNYFDEKINLLDLRSRQFSTNITFNDSVNDFEFSSNGKYLAAASNDGSAKILNIYDRNIVTIKQESSVKDLEFSPDNAYLATASENKSVLIFDLGTQMRSFSSQLRNGSAISVEFSNNSRYLAVASKEGNVNLLDLSNKQIVATIPHNSTVNHMVFSPDSRYFATSSYDCTAKVINLSDLQAIYTIPHKDYVIDIDFSPDSHYLATISRDSTLKLLDIRNWKIAAHLDYEFTVNGDKFSPDSRYLAIANFNGSINLVDLITQKKINVARYEHPAEDMEYSSDGRYLATAGDNIAYLIDLSTLKVSKIERADYVTDIAFSLNSNYLVIGSNHGNVEIITLGTQDTLANLPHNSALEKLEISPNGKYLVNEFDNMLEIKLWLPIDLISEACSRLTRNLTAEEWQSFLSGEIFRNTCQCGERKSRMS